MPCQPVLDSCHAGVPNGAQLLEPTWHEDLIEIERDADIDVFSDEVEGAVSGFVEAEWVHVDAPDLNSTTLGSLYGLVRRPGVDARTFRLHPRPRRTNAQRCAQSPSRSRTQQSAEPSR